MKYITIVALAALVFLAGCAPPDHEDYTDRAARNEKRAALFLACLEKTDKQDKSTVYSCKQAVKEVVR